MSTFGARRMKERGGAGGKVTAAIPNSKPVTPFSDESKLLAATCSSTNRSIGREKPRSVSRGPAVFQKSERIDKSSAAGSNGGDVESRRRMSSVPRGRNSSRCDFGRILSDSRRARVSSVSSVPVRIVSHNRSSDLEISAARVRNGSGVRASDRRVCGDLKENMKPVAKLRKETVRISTEFVVKDEENECLQQSSGVSYECRTDVNLSATRSSHDELKIVKSDGNIPCVQKIRPIFSSDVCGKDVDDLKVLGASEEKEVYPSKLHEKLAFLEGKVKRIASDIKRTKEMLDMNNTDASKVIISDIQEKISGIEKAMSHVVCESDRNSGVSRNMDKDAIQEKQELAVQNNKADDEKILVEGQISDCHQNLLEGQSSIKKSSCDSPTDQCHIVLSSSESSSADRTVSYAIDENPPSLEFLVPLNQRPSKIAMNLHNGQEVSEVQETEDASGSPTQQASNVLSGQLNAELMLTSDEQLEEFNEQEDEPVRIDEGDDEDNTAYQIREIGRKASTGGWFVSEGESVLLVHDDGSCSLHDVANSEVKSDYKPPSAISSNIWSDCWIIRAPGADGCSGKYVVAASAGNTLESGFCSWDFYTKEVQAFHIEEGTTNKRPILAPLQENMVQRRNTLSTMMSTENRQWWYKPLGPLIVSTASFQRSVQVFDIRDGEQIMKWNVQKPVLNMDYSSPLQWRNKGKVVIAEADAVTLWDVGSLTAQALVSVPASGQKISALHVSNTDAEGGGVRQRISSSEAEGHDGVFCTDDSINILDFCQPSGIGLKIPKLGGAQSVFTRGDSVFLGCSSVRSSQVQLFSLRRQKLVSTYITPESNAHILHTSLNQVWGNSDLVMGVCGQGLFVWDVLSDDGLPSFALDYCDPQKAREVIGPDDLYSPSFDYASSQVLLISRDRPAMFRYL